MAFLFFALLFSAVVQAVALHALNDDVSKSGMTGRMERLEKRLLQVERQNENLEAENDKLHDSVLFLKAENEDLKVSLSSLRVENIALKDSVFSLNAKRQKMLDDFVSLSDRVTALESSDTDSDAASAFRVQLDKIHQQTDDTAEHEISLHGVAARSDDVTPLEPVVAQISQQLTEMNAEIQVLKTTDQQHSQAIQKAANSVYVRWGRSVCPSSAVLVYSGVIGGSPYSESGSAVNNLCLSMSPVFNDHPVPDTYFVALLYGAEYETFDSHMNEDPVCAVCRLSRPTVVMIPGTNVCLPGWTLEYSGFLMGGYHGAVTASEYICVDSQLEDRPGTNQDQNGKLLYYTLTRCGSLPCHPYVNNKVVTCAVCSK